MPFPTQSSRPFSRESVLDLNPGLMGCYGLFVDGGEWVYIGKGDIRKRLLAHLDGDDNSITKAKPTHFQIVVRMNFDQLEKQLITEYRPILRDIKG